MRSKIQYTVAVVDGIGHVALVSHKRKLVRVVIAQSERDLVIKLHTELAERSKYLILRTDDELADLRERFLECINGNGPLLRYKFLWGTEFQHLVWQRLSEIPRGSTITYGEVARDIGRPKAVRATAQACKRNPIPLVIPCHRVVGANGLTGFAYGLDMKKALLQREKATRKLPIVSRYALSSSYI